MIIIQNFSSNPYFVSVVYYNPNSSYNPFNPHNLESLFMIRPSAATSHSVLLPHPLAFLATMIRGVKVFATTCTPTLSLTTTTFIYLLMTCPKIVRILGKQWWGAQPWYDTRIVAILG